MDSSQASVLEAVEHYDHRRMYRCYRHAIKRYGRPEILNTDQCMQFTSELFTGILRAINIDIIMDGKGRWMGKVFIETLWRSVKYEHVYLHSYDSIAYLRQGPKTYFGFFSQAHLSVTCYRDAG